MARTVTLKDFYNFLSPRIAGFLGVGVVTGLLLFVAEVVFAYGLQSLTVAMRIASPASIEIPRWLPCSSFGVIFTLMIIIGVFRSALQWLSIWLQGAIFDEFRFVQRVRLVESTFRAPSVSASTVLNMFNEQISSSASAVTQALMIAVFSTQGLLVALSLFIISWEAALAGILFLGLFSFLLKGIDRWVREAGEGFAHESVNVTGQIVRGIRNLILIQIYGMQKTEETQTVKSLERFRNHVLRFHFLSGMKFAIPQILGVILVCLLAAGIYYRQIIRPSVAIAYFYLFFRFVQSISSVSMSTSSFLGHFPQMKSLFMWWRENCETFYHLQTDSTLNIEKMSAYNGPIGWSIKHVSYRYPKATQDVLKDFNFDIMPGQFVVICGRSGSGKSTFLSLILGNLSATEGEVCVLSDVGQKNLAAVRDNVCASVGYVGPEPFLVEGTIYSNLTYGLRVRPTDEALRSAIELADAGFVFSDFKEGLDHIISDQGHGLSAGQKQRLALARALLRNPKALILDEATANLDVDTEANIIRTLEKMRHRTTIIAVTHRDSFSRLADTVLRFD